MGLDTPGFTDRSKRVLVASEEEAPIERPLINKKPSGRINPQGLIN